MPNTPVVTYSRKNLKPLPLLGEQFLCPERTTSQSKLPDSDRRSKYMKLEHTNAMSHKRRPTKRKVTFAASSSSDSESQPFGRPGNGQSKSRNAVANVSGQHFGPRDDQPPRRKRHLPINELTLLPLADTFHLDVAAPPLDSDEEDRDSISEDQSKLRKAKRRKEKCTHHSTREVSISVLGRSFKRTSLRQPFPTPINSLHGSKGTRNFLIGTGNDGFVGSELVVPPRMKLQKTRQAEQPLSVPLLELRRGPLPDVVFTKDSLSTEKMFPLITKAATKANSSDHLAGKQEIIVHDDLDTNAIPTSAQMQTLIDNTDHGAVVTLSKKPVRISTMELFASITAPAREPERDESDSESQDNDNFKDDVDAEDADDEGQEDKLVEKEVDEAGLECDADVAELEDDHQSSQSENDDEEGEERIIYGVPGRNHYSLEMTGFSTSSSTIRNNTCVSSQRRAVPRNATHNWMDMLDYV